MLFKYDLATVEILFTVYEDAWAELQLGPGASDSLSAVAITSARLTRALIRAADSGERNPVRLKTLALDGVLDPPVTPQNLRTERRPLSVAKRLPVARNTMLKRLAPAA